MPQGTQSKKALPKRAGKRKGNGYSARCFARSQRRKAERRAENARRHKDNLTLREMGELTPWESACADRILRRLNDQNVQRRARGYVRERAGLGRE